MQADCDEWSMKSAFVDSENWKFLEKIERKNWPDCLGWCADFLEYEDNWQFFGNPLAYHF